MSNQPPIAKTDVETGQTQPLYPKMSESPELRWSFIHRIYSIVAIQLLLTIAFGAVIALYHPINTFLTTTRGGSICFLLAFITPLIDIFVEVMCLYSRVPIVLLSSASSCELCALAFLTVCVAFLVGLTCAIVSRKVILEAAILTTVVVVSLTLFTFWAAKGGYDFGFFGPFLFGSLMVILVFGLIQVFFPLGKISVMMYGCLSAIIFCGYIVYDTDNLIKRYTYDDHIWSAVALYLDVITLFMGLLTVFTAAKT